MKVLSSLYAIPKKIIWLIEMLSVTLSVLGIILIAGAIAPATGFVLCTPASLGLFVVTLNRRLYALSGLQIFYLLINILGVIQWS